MCDDIVPLIEDFIRTVNHYISAGGIFAIQQPTHDITELSHAELRMAVPSACLTPKEAQALLEDRAKAARKMREQGKVLAEELSRAGLDPHSVLHTCLAHESELWGVWQGARVELESLLLKLRAGQSTKVSKKADKAKPKRSADEVAKELDRWRLGGHPYGSVRKQAKRIECSTDTIHNALRHNDFPLLLEWSKQDKARATVTTPRARKLTEVDLNSIPQTTESNDISDHVICKEIEELKNEQAKDLRESQRQSRRR